MKFEYLDNLIDWEWWPLLIMERDFLSTVVRLFCFFGDDNLYDGKKKIRKVKDQFPIKVFGRDLLVNGEFVNELLGIDKVDGPKSIPHGFNYVKACQVVYKNKNLTEFVGDVKKFDVHTRILHLIITHTLNPRQGGHAVVNREYIFWLCKITQGNPLNLGEFIVQRMVKGVGWCKSVNDYMLPCGKFVSQLIEKVVGPFPRDELSEPGIGKAKIDKGDLKQMKFKYHPSRME